jgi:hypothetical protein
MRASVASHAHRRRLLFVAPIAFAMGVLQAACSPTVDLKDGLQVETVATGWASVRADKVVPVLSFRLKNISDQKLVVLQLNVRFRSVDEKDEWGYAFRTVTGSAGLVPGAVTDTLTLKAPFGYVGRGADRMVANFAEAKVELFAKYASTQWTPVGEYHIARQLVDR